MANIRIAQPIAEKRTWPKHFLSLVREISPSYELNKRVKGTTTECLREVVPGGVFASHNTFCKRGRYHHCFGITLSPILFAPYLHSPFFIGGRFDHNGGIAKAFMGHMGLTPDDRRERGMSWHDSHEWRLGTDDIVRRITQTAEQHLLPFYLRRLMDNSDNIKEMLACILDALKLPEDELRKRVGNPLPSHFDLSLYELTEPRHAWMAMPIPEKYYALTLIKRPALLAAIESIPDMLKRLDQTQKTLMP